jgi:hypothetical protein
MICAESIRRLYVSGLKSVFYQRLHNSVELVKYTDVKTQPNMFGEQMMWSPFLVTGFPLKSRRRYRKRTLVRGASRTHTVVVFMMLVV